MATKPDFKQIEPLTIGDIYGYGVEITNPDEARTYFEEVVTYQMNRFGLSRDEAEKIERSNFGYYAGYYDHETMARVELLYGASHPIFGSVANGPVSADEAFKAGQKLAKRQ